MGWLFDLIGLAGLGFGTCFERAFMSKLYTRIVVYADALGPNHVVPFGDAFCSFHTKIHQLGNMREAMRRGKEAKTTQKLYSRFAVRSGTSTLEPSPCARYGNSRFS
jgi:hypothetical protein